MRLICVQMVRLTDNGCGGRYSDIRLKIVQNHLFENRSITASSNYKKLTRPEENVIQHVWQRVICYFLSTYITASDLWNRQFLREFAREPSLGELFEWFREFARYQPWPATVAQSSRNTSKRFFPTRKCRVCVRSVLPSCFFFLIDENSFTAFSTGISAAHCCTKGISMDF